MFRSTNNRVQSKLLSVFLLQLILISIVTVIGVMSASLIFERLLVNKALQGEAEFFWSNRADQADFPLPQTLNLKSYLSSSPVNPVPVKLQKLDLGQHHVDDEFQRLIVHVSENKGDRLYLLFAKGTVSSLAFYYGILPLILVLLTMYGFAFLTYLLSKHAVSPITRLASVIERFDFNTRDANELNLASLDQSSNSETKILANTLNHFVQRTSASIERERNFTRFASHELRTPLAVIQGSVSSLELLDLEGAPARAVQRISRISRQMSELLNTLLLLAREETEVGCENFKPLNVNELTDTLVAEMNTVYADKSNRVTIEHRKHVFVKAPEAVLSIVIGNILGNAFSYTRDDEIHVRIGNRKITVTDNGVGMDKKSLDQAFEPFFRANNDSDNSLHQHQGLGLAIVKQSCRKYGWKIALDSQPGVGTQVMIDFGA